MSAVSVNRVSKTYPGGFQAVKDISFVVRQAECYGLLGPNGAGKSSLMRMLYHKTLRDKGPGTVDVLGFDPARHELEIKFLSGIVPQDDNLDVELGVMDNLMVYSQFYGIQKSKAKKRISELLDFMELGEKKKARIRELSGGMRRRLIIARALLNNPRLLILDEPTTGLDPQVRHMIWDKLRILKSEGVTMILTTHYMEEAFQLCDRLMIMDKGAQVIEGTPSSLVRDHIEGYVLEIVGREAGSRVVYTGPARREETNDRMLFYHDRADELESIAKPLRPGDFHLRQSHLEDVFLKFTGRTLHE